MMNIWRKLRRDRLALLCIGYLAMLTLVGLCAPWLAPHDPANIQLNHKLAGMSLEYPLGTDHMGRCVLSRLIFGIRATVWYAWIAMLCTIAIGAVLGMIAGICRGKVDEILMRICDMLLAFPSEIMILAFIGLMGPGMLSVIVANVAAKWAWYARMMRAVVIQYTDKSFIHFAKVSGASPMYLLRRHIFPLASGEIIMFATLDIGWVILNISALSFLGIGVQAPTAEWGMMLNDAKNLLFLSPAQMLPAGITIVVTVAAFNYIGDRIRSVLHPQHYEKQKEMKNDAMYRGSKFMRS